MEQVKGKQRMNELKAAGNFVAGGGPIENMVSSAKSAYNTYLKPTVDKATKLKNQTFGTDFLKDNVVNQLKHDAKSI